MWVGTLVSAILGRPLGESHSRQPDSGNPTVRDETGGLRKRDIRSDSYLPRSWKRRIPRKLLTFSCARRISIPSDPLWPRAMRRRPVMAWRSVSRGTHRRSIELRNHRLGVPTTSNGGEGNMGWCDSASDSPAPRSQRPAAYAYAPCAEAGRARK